MTVEFETPIKSYSQVESDWIREEIAEREFDNPEDREFVNRLIRIEHYVLEGASSFAGGMAMHRLKRCHPKAFDRIQAELHPDEYEARKQRERDRIRERRLRAAHRRLLKKQRLQTERERWEQVKQNQRNGVADD